MFHVNRSRVLVAMLFSLLLTACGGGGGGSSAVATVAKVEIQQTGLLLTDMGATRQLSAVAYDAQGGALSVPIQWSSTQTAIGVDGSGKVTAATNNGSSQIVAEANGVKSAPLLVVVTTLPAGAILLTDAQIVGEPFETDPNAPPSFDNTYKVVLTGVGAPAMGSLLINTESKPVVGRVVGVDTAGGQTTVTLALVSLREAFPNLVLIEVIDLAQAEVIVPADVSASYDIQRNGNTMTFTPKPAAIAAVRARSISASPTTLSGATAVTLPGGIVLECESSVTGDGASLPIQLSVPPAFSITRNLVLDTVNTPSGGLERLVLKGDVAAKAEVSAGVAAAFEGKVSCETELYVIRLPIGAPLSALAGGLVPIKAGFELGGKVTVATAALGVKAEAKMEVELGVACPSGTNCAFVRSISSSGSAEPVFDLPDIGDLRFEPSVSGFAKADLAIGNPVLTSLRFDAFYAQSGPKLAFSLAPQLSQIADTNYKSNYTLQNEKKAGIKLKFGDALELLGLGSVSVAELTDTVEIGKSPTGTVTADRTTFVTGDVINFHVALDAGTVNFIPLLGPYNVSRILLVSNDGPLSTSVIASVNATDGQTVFDIPYTATRAGNVSEIFAFVDTVLLPSLDVLTLEVGNAQGSASKIAFASERDGNYEIYVMNADGSGQTRVTKNAAVDFYPAWSPDGTRIAFTSTRDGNFEIYVMNADGSGQTRVTNNAAADTYPAWSPDGTRIAFASERDDSEIYVMNADGSGQTNLTNNAASDQFPAWSPDGTRIAFASSRDGNYEIYVMNADGSGQTRVTNNAATDAYPAWSPDGTRIAFASTRDGNFEIYVMNADGSGQTRLTNNATTDYYPAWSR